MVLEPGVEESLEVFELLHVVRVTPEVVRVTPEVLVEPEVVDSDVLDPDVPDALVPVEVLALVPDEALASVRVPNDDRDDLLRLLDRSALRSRCFWVCSSQGKMAGMLITDAMAIFDGQGHIAMNWAAKGSQQHGSART